MEIDNNKLAQMRAESQNAQNILEEALSENPDIVDSSVFVQEEMKTPSVSASPRLMSLSPIKEKIGKSHLAFLKDIHELGKQDRSSCDDVETITKKYRINLFSALTALDTVAKEKYKFSILKENRIDQDSEKIIIEFDSANVDQFLSLERSESWKTELGCNRPDDSDFLQQVATYLDKNGVKITQAKQNTQKTTTASVQTKTVENNSKIELVSHPDLEKEYGITLECSARYDGGEYAKFFYKAIAKKKFSKRPKLYIIGYDKNGVISYSDYTYLKLENNTLAADTYYLSNGSEIVKIEYFPGE